MNTMKTTKDTERTDDVVPHLIPMLIIYQSVFAAIR